MTAYTFTWDVSAWGTASATWSSPGVYDEKQEQIAAATAAMLGSDAAVIRTSGLAAAVTAASAQVGYVAYVDPGNTGVYVSATAARVYNRLPARYRDDDALVGTFPLLRWLASLVDLAGDVEGYLNRFADPTRSALTDPALADAAWLSWLGQLVGIRVENPPGDIPSARQQIAAAVWGAQPGTRAGIVAAVQQILTGTKTVTVTDHYSGDQWKIQVSTLTGETPVSPVGAVPGYTGFVWGTSVWGETTEWAEPDLVLFQIAQSRAKPAGFTLVHTLS